MSMVKFLSREKLVEYLDEEVRLFLNSNGIYEINQYGWLIDDRPDPEYMGFAMWQAEPPINHNKISRISETTEAPAFSQIDMEKIFNSGLVFKELMKSARHSIGLTYLYHKDHDKQCKCTNYHLPDAVLKLNMATDRLRKLFVTAFSILSELNIENHSSDLHHSLKEQNIVLNSPFHDARDLLAENPGYYEELLDCVESLLPFVELISNHQEKFIVGNDFSITTYNSPNKKTVYPEQKDSVPNEEEVTHGLSDWYKLLIKASNQVFMAEYLLRNFDSPAPIVHIVVAH